jgi:hypothetical protein
VVQELEEEKCKHEHDTAQGDDITYGLEKDRTRLKQVLTHLKMPKPCLISKMLFLSHLGTKLGATGKKEDGEGLEKGFRRCGGGEGEAKTNCASSACRQETSYYEVRRRTETVRRSCTGLTLNDCEKVLFLNCCTVLDFE